MIEFRLNFLGKIWDNDFKFSDNPAIEIVREIERLEIYEKPYLSFTAYGELSDLIENIFLVKLCQSQPIQVIQNNVVVWDGVVRIADIVSVFNDVGRGSYKEVEIIDNNLNQWFLNRERAVIEIDRPFDLECNVTSVPTRIAVDFHGFDDPLLLRRRNVYRFTDILTHMVKIVSSDNVTLVSDFFSTGPGSGWVFCTGDQLVDEFQFSFLPFVSWEQITEFMARSYRLVRFHYQVGGVSFIRIEPYEFFFDESDNQIWDAVSGLTFGTKLDRLYSTTQVGDESAVSKEIESTYLDFEFNTFKEQEVAVGSECGSGAELKLSLNDITVNTNKIEVALVDGDTIKTYEEDLFVIDTNLDIGIATSKVYLQGTKGYYNEDFFNGQVISRWFDGTAPITVYPDQFDDLNYFKVTQEIDELVGIFLTTTVPPFPTVTLGRLWFEGLQFDYDPDNALSNFSSFNGSTPTPVSVSAPNVTRFTCAKPGFYKVAFDWGLFLAGGVSDFGEPPPIRMYAVLDHTTSGGVPIQQFTSPPVQVSDGQVFKLNQLNWSPPSFAMNIGDRLSFYARSSSVPNVVVGTMEFGISGGSSVSVIPCGNLVTDPQLGFKQQIYEITYNDYPLAREDFDILRDRPGMRQLINTYNCNDQRQFAGYIETLKFDLITCKTEVKLVSSERPPFASDNQCWALNECGDAYWQDECTWFDNRLWCDN